MSIFLSEASFLFIISDYIPMSEWASFFIISVCYFLFQNLCETK